jgi:hypothetical protein
MFHSGSEFKGNPFSQDDLLNLCEYYILLPFEKLRAWRLFEKARVFGRNPIKKGALIF